MIWGYQHQALFIVSSMDSSRSILRERVALAAWRRALKGSRWMKLQMHFRLHLTHYRRACTAAQLVVLGPFTKARCVCPACLLHFLAHVACASPTHTTPTSPTHTRRACLAPSVVVKARGPVWCYMPSNPGIQLLMIFEYSGNECSGQIKQVGEPIEVRITEWNAKGLLTRIEGLRAFLPKGELVKRVNRFTELKENGLVLLFLTSIGQHILLSYVLIEMKEITTKKTSATTHSPPPRPTPQVHTYPSDVNNQPPPPVTSQSNIALPTSQPRTLKKRLFSTKSNCTLDQLNVQHPVVAQFDIQPTLDIAYESTSEVTPEIQSESEEEATEMQTEQSKHVSRKRSWLVDSEYRQQLSQQRDDGTCNRDDLIAMGPEGVNKDHWDSFVDYRLSSRTKEICKKNKDNRKRQTVLHARKMRWFTLGETSNALSLGEGIIVGHMNSNIKEDESLVAWDWA
ncbi:hypothetical protein Fmac_025238 [Flemingia macrophylla]|uniref:S1 motif domain-containing protein n=1 Tax=Flemingia macrophylla TaxID=520843 RepID=A0ABD1LTD0_9FABA